MAISMYKPDSILDLVSYAFGGMGAAFGPSILLALYWRRFNFWGAVSGVVVGTVVSSIWGFASGGPGGVWNIMVGTPGFAAGAVAAVAITLLTRAPSSEVVALFDNVNPPKLALTVNTNSRE
jgi:sodium/proline symporter